MYSDEEIRETYLENRRKVRWEITRGKDKDFIFAVAKEKGWLETPPKVQVRRVFEPGLRFGEEIEYYAIEPYEEDCNCPNIVPPPTSNEG